MRKTGKKSTARKAQARITVQAERTTELSLLQELQEPWRRALDIEETLALLGKVVHDYLKTDQYAVLLFDQERQKFMPTGTSTIEEMLLAHLADLAHERRQKALAGGQTVQAVRFRQDGALCRFTMAFMVAGIELLGVIIVGDSSAPAKPGPARRQRLLGIIAAQGTATLHYLRSCERVTQRKVVGGPSLYQEARPVNLRTGATRVLFPIVDLVCATFAHTACALYLRDAEKHTLRLVVAQPPQPDETVIDIDEDPLIQELVREGKALLINDIAQEGGDGVRAARPQVRSLMAVCMLLDGNVLGTINLSNAAPNAYTEGDLRHLSIIANHAALIYHTASNLLHLEAIFQDVLESVPVGIVALDHQAQTALANRLAGSILGVPPAQRTVRYAEMMERLAAVRYRRPTPQTGWPGPYEVKVGHLGEDRIIKVRQSPLRLKGTEAIGDVIVLEDVTLEKNLETQMQRAERMAVLGELSAGIAHEIKNPLTSLKGFAQLLPQKYDNAQFRQKFVGIVNNEVDRLNQIVEGMLSFAAPKVRTFAPCDLNRVLHQVFLLVEHQCDKHRVTVTRDLADELWVHGDAHGLEQVFLNIVVNAIDAMPQGGTLSIRTALEGVAAKVVISDTGQGIPPEILGRIYNPFFTTKAHGTGLGLAISYRIIEEHAGLIDVKSELGRGTTFTITLPVLREKEKSDALPSAGR